MDRYCCNSFWTWIDIAAKCKIHSGKQHKSTFISRKETWAGSIFFFNPSYALSAGLRSSDIADFTMALKAISRMLSLISSGVHSSLCNVATFTYFSWGRMRAVVRDYCEARESRSKSSSACVAPIQSAAVLVGVNGLFNLREFAGGGESNENAPRAVLVLAISCCFLCISIISANWRLISVICDSTSNTLRRTIWIRKEYRTVH